MQKNILFFVLFLLVYPVFAQEKLDEVKIVKKRKGLQKSFTVTGNTTVLTSKELLKAACCNLAESFETNPSIDVNFSDAISGTKQIKMLGLTSPYLLFTEENIPSVRGASQLYGMSFTPGTWIESIQITKGAGSVVNGFESISGQINTELLKPINNQGFFLNLYGSSDSRFELNTHLNSLLSDKWSSSLFLHGNTRTAKMDVNDDGFMDNPLAKQINILNRYQYYDAEKGWVSFINLRYLNDQKQMGQLSYNPKIHKGTQLAWGSEIDTERLDIATKIGYVFKDLPYQSIGFQNAFNTHQQQSYFGLNNYTIKQTSYYSNLIFNSIINSTRHKFATGLNFTSDRYEELVSTRDWSRTDTHWGSFFEYTFDNDADFSLILGGRVDFHNRLGTFLTPRLHLRYNPWAKAVVRFSAGRGKRSANVFAENQSIFASARAFSILDNQGEIYGLNPEIAWNYGASFTQSFLLLGRKADFTLDWYRTDFQQQVVVDLMQSSQQVLLYNLKGKSFATSFQLEFNYEITKNLHWRSAYKRYNVETDYLSGRFQKPLQAKNRFFANIEYESPTQNGDKQWRFDFTFHWIVTQLLPNPLPNPITQKMANYAPSYSLMNTQITRVFSKLFEVYIGGENIGNYKQSNPILGADQPFGSNFDTSVLYAPVFGRMVYAGLRWNSK